jgi:replicative superfamily II helicase
LLHCWPFAYSAQGDTNASSGLEQAKRARVIVATPEKWDRWVPFSGGEGGVLTWSERSITRRWNDNEPMLRSVKLLLVDEVRLLSMQVRLWLRSDSVLHLQIHTLRERGRGATHGATSPDCGGIS